MFSLLGTGIVEDAPFGGLFDGGWGVTDGGWRVIGSIGLRQCLAGMPPRPPPPPPHTAFSEGPAPKDGKEGGTANPLRSGDRGTRCHADAALRARVAPPPPPNLRYTKELFAISLKLNTQQKLNFSPLVTNVAGIIKSLCAAIPGCLAGLLPLEAQLEALAGNFPPKKPDLCALISQTPECQALVTRIQEVVAAAHSVRAGLRGVSQSTPCRPGAWGAEHRRRQARLGALRCRPHVTAPQRL